MSNARTDLWRKRISSIRVSYALNTRLQFLSVVALFLKVVDATDPREWAGAPVETMATDGEHLIVNPDFLMSLTPQEAEFVVAHEVLHAALRHPFRLFGRDAELANVAMDYVINLILSDMGFDKGRPSCALYDTRYRGKAWDEVYAELMQKPKGARPKLAPGAGRVLMHDPTATKTKGSAASTAAAEATMQRVAIQAAAAMKAAQGAGNMPAELQRLLQNMRPVLDWRVVLRNFISSANSRIEDWARPSRRVGSYVGVGSSDIQISLPGYRREGFGHLVFAVDTSGSVDVPQLSACMAEMKSACAEAGLSSVSVVYADAKVAATYYVDLEAGDELSEKKCPPKGGGGTDFAPTFKWIDTDFRARECIGVVYFTDLECSSFGVPPPYPVLWLVHGPEHKANSFIPLAESAFGQAIRMPLGV